MNATKTISAPVQSAVADLIGELHAKSGGDKFGIACEGFAAILCEVATKYLPEEGSESEARIFLQTLRVDHEM